MKWKQTEKHLVISRHISVRLLLYLSVIAITGWQAPITSHDRYTAWWSFKLLPHAAIWGRSRQRCFRLCKIFWIAGRAAGYLKCSICGFAPRSISLTVNCPLMFYTLIILFTSSKCASSVHSFVFLSICLAYPQCTFNHVSITRGSVFPTYQIYNDVSEASVADAPLPG